VSLSACEKPTSKFVHSSVLFDALFNTRFSQLVGWNMWVLNPRRVRIRTDHKDVSTSEAATMTLTCRVIADCRRICWLHAMLARLPTTSFSTCAFSVPSSRHIQGLPEKTHEVCYMINFKPFAKESYTELAISKGHAKKCISCTRDFFCISLCRLE